MLEQQVAAQSVEDAMYTDEASMTQLEGIRQKVFMDRYSLKDASGTPLEHHPEQLWTRVARGIAEVEKTSEARAEWEKKFYDTLSDFQFVPGGRILAGAGSGHSVTFYNCFVIPSPEDSRQGILDNLKLMTEIMARGGGVGINLSSLRPRGSYIRTVNGTASGPCSWAQLYSVATGDVIQQGGSRRGALMLMLDDDHPDVEEFITVKRTAGKIEHANLSVCISDKFMQAVKDDADWNLIWQGEIKKTIRARHLWDLICTSAWESAEPGMVFMDRYNKLSNTWYYENIRCVNPCVTGDTLIYTDQGLITARSLAEQATPVTVVSPNIRVGEPAIAGPAKAASRTQRPGITQTDQSVSLREASHVFITGIRQVYKLQTKEGYTVRLTDDHKVLTTQGWKKAGDLTNGDKIHLLNGRGAFGKTGNEEFGLVSGWLVKSLVEQELHTSTPQVPPAVFKGSRSMQKGFLSALFTADGSVQGTMEEGISVHLTSTSKTLVEGVQRLLLNFGIASYMRTNRREAGMHKRPDGKDNKAFSSGQTYTDLAITKSNLKVFASEIGFLAKEKQDRLIEYLDRFACELHSEHFLATFESLVPDGEETVYDLSEPEQHLFVGNGIICHNCGEQGLPPYGVCNLGAMNLSAFVHDKQFDYERLAEKTRVAMRFLDNVVDSTEYFIQENAEAQLGTRRTGLGTMGLADALIKMEIAYGSDESVPVIEKIYATIRDAAYEASADYAAEKGPFPHFERDKYMQGHFIKQLPKAIQEKIKKHGTRNAVLLTQAPTGTTSLLSGVSSGIEPVYDFAMIRRDRTGEHILYHPLLQIWRDEHPNEPTPHYFVSSKDLTPEEHVRVQATIQKYTDSSISKTVNAPNDHTVEQVQKLYRLAYEMGCKGITYYRDGSRDAVLTRIEDEKKAEQKEEQQAVMLEPVASIQQGIKPRPSVVQGYTRQVNAPEGKINVTINSDEHGPLEVFVNVGKAGSDIAALAEALGRLISLNLRVLSPLSQVDRAKEIAEQLRGIGGSRSVGFGAQQVRSMPDAVARALELHMSSLERETTREPDLAQQSNEQNSHTNGNGQNHEAVTGDQEIQPLALSKMSVTGNLCPECGCNTMIYEEGCKKCYSCGYSEC